jgi:hypothetical protein
MAEDLRRCIASIKLYADRIIVVEGLFGHHWRTGPDFENPYSSDGTFEAAQELGCEVTHSHGLWQCEQRDLYLKGKEGDVYFLIDADMTLEGSLDKNEMLHGGGNVWACWVEDPDGNRQISPIWASRHIGAKVHHAPGNIRVDGYGKLMDASYPGGRVLTTCYLKHYNMRGRK